MIRMSTSLRPRHTLTEATRKLAAARGIIVNGPRQAGKSQLLAQLGTDRNAEVLSLDQPALLRAARTDPTGFVSNRRRPLLIDEVQRAGNPLVLALKAMLDSSDETGQVALAGSTRFLTEPRLSESLAGRVRFVDLWPFAQGEIDELGVHADRFVDTLLSDGARLRDVAGAAPGLSRSAIFERVCCGGFPEAVRIASLRDRSEFFADYVRTISQRDIRELGRIGERVELPVVLRALAERTANLVNAANLADAVRLTPETLRRYLPLLETIFLTLTIPAFGDSAAARTRRRPKLYVTDPGLCAAMLGVSADRLMHPEASMAGSLLETFIATEIIKQLGWSTEQAAVTHFRDADGRAVDLVLSTPDGRVAAIEVKAAIDVDERDFRGLAHLRDHLGPRFVNGVVMHCGHSVGSWGDRLTSVPVSALWTPAPP